MGEMYDIAEGRAMEELAMSENLKTYDEWKECGFHVLRGERACGRNEHGVALFSELQVEEDFDDYEDVFGGA